MCNYAQISNSPKRLPGITTLMHESFLLKLQLRPQTYLIQSDRRVIPWAMAFIKEKKEKDKKKNIRGFFKL